MGVCLAHTNGGLRCGHIPKRGVLGAGTPPKRGSQERAQSEKWDLKNFSCKKRGSYELKLHKRGFLGTYLSHIFTFTCQYDLQTKRGVLGIGTTRKVGEGVLGARPTRKKGGGGLRCGSGKTKWVFTAAHTCTGHICESPPHIMLEVGLQKSMGHGIYSSYLWGKNLF